MNSYAQKNLILPEKDTVIKLLVKHKNLFVVGASSLKITKGSSVLHQITMPSKVNDAVVYRGKIIIATEKGLYQFNEMLKQFVPFIQSKVSFAVHHLAVDALSHLWIVNSYEGCFMIKDDSELIEKIKSGAVYQIASTPDSCVWIGTNTGLYKIVLNGEKIFRYAEEGMEGFELPDNLVERIYADQRSNVWALMPEHTSYIPSSSGNNEIPSFNYVGSANNVIFSIASFSKDHSYLFATKEGVLHVDAVKQQQTFSLNEIHQTYNQDAVYVNDDVLQRPSIFKKEIIYQVIIEHGEVYLLCRKGIWWLKEKKFLKRL